MGRTHSPLFFTPGRISSFDLIFYNSSFRLVCSSLLAVLTLHAYGHHKGFPSFSLGMFFPQIAKELTPSFSCPCWNTIFWLSYMKKHVSPLNARTIFLYKLFIDIYMCACVCICVSVPVYIETAQILSVCLIYFHKVNSAM